MKINREYMSVMRRGKWLNKQTYRKEIESGMVLGYCLLSGPFIFLFAYLIY